VSACRLLADKVQFGSLSPYDITEELFSASTYTGRQNIPDPDLILRTAGENRLSNFLLWQSAYAEFISLPTLCKCLFLHHFH